MAAGKFVGPAATTRKVKKTRLWSLTSLPSIYCAEKVARTVQREHLCYALDKINQKHDPVSEVNGVTPDAGRTLSGTKIAFARIPDREDFKG